MVHQGNHRDNCAQVERDEPTQYPMRMTAEVKQPHEDHVDKRSDSHGVPQDGGYPRGETVNPRSPTFVEGVELSQRVLVQQSLRLGLWLETGRKA